MTRKVFSVFDSVAKVYGMPFVFVHEGEAMRWLNDMVRDDRSLLSKHPEDYKLYRLGTFDDIAGKFNIQEPEFLCNAVDFVPASQKGVISNDKN